MKISNYSLLKQVNIKNIILSLAFGIGTGIAAIFGGIPLVLLEIIILFLCIAAYSRNMYKLFVLMNIFLLSVVLIEPAPSDIIFCILAVLGLIGGKIKLFKAKQQLFILAMFVLYFTVSMVGITRATDNSNAIRYYAISFYLFLFSIFIFLYTSKENVIQIVNAYIYSSIFAALLGLAGYMGIFSEILMADTFRVRALFKDPNVFGPFLIPAVILLLDGIINGRKLPPKRTFINIAMIFVCAAGVILSFSRAAWINLAVSLALYYLLSSDIKRIIKTIAILAAVAVLISSVWVLTEDNGFKDFFSERARMQDYDKNRFDSQKAGIYLSAENPTGYGPGQYELEASKKTGIRLSAHNLYIRLLMEDGAAGFILFFTALLCIIVRLISIHKSCNRNFLSSSVLISIMFGLMVNSLVVDTLHWRHLWLFIGLSLFRISESGEVP